MISLKSIIKKMTTKKGCITISRKKCEDKTRIFVPQERLLSEMILDNVFVNIKRYPENRFYEDKNNLSLIKKACSLRGC